MEKQKRLDFVDLLKGIAVLMIYFVHTPQKIEGLDPLLKKFSMMGEMGCQLFFLLAGFCAVMSWKQKKPTLLSFYKSKFLGLAIPYYVMILFYFILNSVLYRMHLPVGFIQNASRTPFLQNLFLVHGFLTAGHNNVVPGGWFVGVLFFFFFLFPAVNKILTALYAKWKTWIWLLPVLVFLINQYVIPPAEKFILIQCGAENIFDFSDILNNFPVFLMGCILWFTFPQTASFFEKRKFVLYLSGVGAFLLAWHDYYWPAFIGKQFSWGIFWIVCFIIASFKEGMFEGSLPGRNIVRIGTRSYAVFFVHVVFAWYIIPALITVLNRYVTFVTPLYLIVWAGMLFVIDKGSCCFEKLMQSILCHIPYAKEKENGIKKDQLRV